VELPHLRGLRQRAVLSQEQLAERSGVARDTISKLERGQRRAYPTTVRKLAAGLEVEPRLLFGGVEYSEAASEESPSEETGGGRKVGF
jgi:transcriptional regulator with XRE-family HTH domain